MMPLFVLQGLNEMMHMEVFAYVRRKYAVHAVRFGCLCLVHGLECSRLPLMAREWGLTRVSLYVFACENNLLP